jgi:hypothetical protein
MTIAELLSQLFNLGAHTDVWNSVQAARDFWLIAGLVVVAVVAFAVIAANRHRTPRHH